MDELRKAWAAYVESDRVWRVAENKAFARDEAKDTAQTFIKRYAGCAVPKEDKP